MTLEAATATVVGGHVHEHENGTDEMGGSSHNSLSTKRSGKNNRVATTVRKTRIFRRKGGGGRRIIQ